MQELEEERKAARQAAEAERREAEKSARQAAAAAYQDADWIRAAEEEQLQALDAEAPPEVEQQVPSMPHIRPMMQHISLSHFGQSIQLIPGSPDVNIAANP